MLGATTKTNTLGIEVVVDANERVQAVHPGTGDSSIPRDGSVLSATGDGAAWLEKHASVGDALTNRCTTRSAERRKKGCEPEDIIGGDQGWSKMG